MGTLEHGPTRAVYNRDFTATEFGGPYTVALTWREVDGRMECVGFEVRSRRGEPVTTSLLRRIPVSRIIAGQRRLHAEYLHDLATGALLREPPPHVADEAKRLLPLYEAGKRRYAPEHWEQVARVYTAAYAVGDSPTRAVAETFHVARSTAGKWVARCRGKGLLGRTEQRRAGGIAAEGDGS